MNERRETRKRWVQRGQYAIEVEVELIYPADRPSEPCLEPKTVRGLMRLRNMRRREILNSSEPRAACFKR